MPEIMPELDTPAANEAAILAELDRAFAELVARIPRRAGVSRQPKPPFQVPHRPIRSTGGTRNV